MIHSNQTKRRLLSGAAFFFSFAGLSAYGQKDRLAELSHQAKEMMAQGRFEEAIPIYQQLTKAVPGNPGLILNLGMAQQMAGHPQQAIPNFQTVLKSQPNNVPALTSLGMAELQLNQPKSAIVPLESLLRIQPENPNARGMLAGAYLAVNRATDAADQYRKLTAADAGDPKAWYGLGKSYESLATRSFDALAKEAPQSPYVAALLADSRLQRRQFRSAFFFYKQAQEKLPSLPGLHAGLAKVYEASGHTDWAATEAKAEEGTTRTTCTAANAECQFLRGDYLSVTKEHAAKPSAEILFWKTRAYNQLALSAFNQLGALPESVEIHALKAEILHGHGQDAEAAGEWGKALALAPGDLQVQTQLATSLFLARRYDEAMPKLSELLAKDPTASDLNFMLGESLWRTQQPEKALPYLTTALQANSELLPAHAALGMVLALLNRNAEAVPHLEKAISLDDDGSLHYSLARAYQASGDATRAQQTMHEYQAIKQKNGEVNSELAQEAEITAPGPR